MNIEKHESTSYTPDQIELIKNTVAKNATDDEFKLFLFRCRILGLCPLKGQIHFVKYGSSPGTVVTGIDGFRSKAARTGKHSGTKRGVLRDAKGNCIGGWAEVYRSDWMHPARDEVSLKEYSTGRGNWQKMPETMIKKVAECAVLRMAFPDDLVGLYSHEEMEQAEPAGTKPEATNDKKSEPVTKQVTQLPPLKPVESAAAKPSETKSNAELLEQVFLDAEEKGYDREEVKTMMRETYPEADKANSAMILHIGQKVSDLPFRPVSEEEKNETSRVPF